MILSKVILIDGGAIMFNSIHLQGSMKLLQQEGKLSDSAFIAPIGYTYFSMIISALKRIGIEKNDKVIVALDARNSWRKSFYREYKGQRKALREKQTHIDWDQAWIDVEKINNQLNESTDWHFLKFDNVINLLDILRTEEGENLIGDNYEDWMFDYNYGFEADDIQSVAVRTFPDQEVILVTGDKDLYMLAFYSNTKIYSLNLKKIKGGKGGYAVVDKPLKILADKIRLGDVSDNIIVDKTNDTELEQLRREFIINLCHLPDWVENPIKTVLENLPEKITDYTKLPFQNSLAKRFPQIYEKKNILTYEYCAQLQEKRKEAKKKKAKERYRAKKESLITK